VIIEPKAYSAPNKSTPLVDRTRNAWGYNNLYFPGASAIAPTGNAPKEIQLSSVVVATADSWIESDLSQMPNPVFDQGKDLKGTQWPIAVIGQPAQSNDTSGNPNATPEYYRAPLITVVGDSDFANNQNIQNQENAKMFAAIVTGMSSAKDLITIDRKVLMTRRLILSPEKQNFLNWSSCLLFPALVLIVGIVVWWRRR
jgi:ABC-type uncharacterized transport system involved in gliding motility auxiliary subunit